MGQAAIIKLIIAISSNMNFDPTLALAVATHESKLDQSAVGALGELGVFQIRPEFSDISVAKLKDTESNIIEGIRKLKEAQVKCKHQGENEFLICYNMGVAKASHIRYPRKFIYYVKVMSIYNNIKLAEQDHREYYFGGPGVFYADFTVNTTFLNKEY